MPASFSQFARGVKVEGAFEVLAHAKRLRAAGKDVIELEIGDSPFPTTAAAKRAGIAAIETDQTHYGPSMGLPEVRASMGAYFAQRFAVPVGGENVVVGPGAKVFELLFCEAFLDPGDAVLVFSPHFPTYVPNIERRGARIWLAPLREEQQFRPQAADVAAFLERDPRPKAIFLNSPHNPTGGVAEADDLRQIADLVRGRNVVVFADEPYDAMVWRGRHHTLLEQPGMLDQCVAAYTFSKSYSMSGWRVGYAVTSPAIAEMFGRLINTSLSCTSPIVQWAAKAALEADGEESVAQMDAFRDQVQFLARGLAQIEGVSCLEPAATFYAFPNVKAVCNRLGLTSQGLAMYLLAGADERLGVACLGGECFGTAGAGFLRLSCAEPRNRLQQALEFLPVAFSRSDRAAAFAAAHPEHRLEARYTE
ncbi:MAG: aminotransferase class I/II-fold pyridoxal phosphate-dependent enzyme [Pirellulales bacterium]|nr:aminotransferase class I/II-fold pyridoxal phosphate-dependent enzyme [Pirellulales bacterium]